MAIYGPNTGDPQGGALMARALANRRQADYTASTAPPSVVGAPAVVGGVLPDPKWEGLFQALADQGVTNASTSAAHGVDDPYSKLQTPAAGSIHTHQTGFFDAQDPQNLQRQALMAQLQAQDVNAGRAPTTPASNIVWTGGVQRAR